MTAGRSSRFGRLERPSPSDRLALLPLQYRERAGEMIRKIEVERFSLTTSKPFDEVVAGVNGAIGHPDMAECVRSTHEARSFAELKSAVDERPKQSRTGAVYAA